MPPNSTVETVIEADLQQHLEDDIEVNAIRDGQLVTVHWNNLTEAEQRAAYVTLFSPCSITFS